MSGRKLQPEQQTLLEMVVKSCKTRFDEHEKPANTVVFVGNKAGGKSTLINLLLDRNESTKPTLALDYCFGRRSGRNSTWSSEVCHIFELGGGTSYTDLLTAPISTASLKHLAFVLVLDLSRPSEIWDCVERVNGTVRNLVLTAAQVDNRSSQLKEAARARAGHLEEAFVDPFPVPLVIVGVKYDVFQDFESEKKEAVCRCLRNTALCLGASLFFSSSKDPSLLKRVREVLVHCAFDSHPPSKSVSLEAGKPLSVPCGADSFQLAGAGTNPLAFQNSSTAIARWKQTCLALHPHPDPRQLLSTQNLDSDPATDPNFSEPEVDALRKQKDAELSSYRQANHRRKAEKLK